MSRLIDELVNSDIVTNIKTQYEHEVWYIAKPIQYVNYKTIIQRIGDAIRVLRGKSFAVHYKEDEK